MGHARFYSTFGCWTLAALLGGEGIVSPQSLSYSTYFGGESSDVVTAAATDAAGNIYLTGHTNSTAFPAAEQVHARITSGECGGSEDAYRCFDAFVAKLDPTGQRLLWVSLLGGSGHDFATALAVDGGGNVYVAGYTNSTDLPVSGAAHAGGICGSEPCFDAFVAKLDKAGGAWIFAAYLGGSGDDFARAIAVDDSGNAVVAGTTTSTDFPVLNAFQLDWQGGETEAFVAKFDATGQRIFASTLGGGGDDFATSAAINSAGVIFLAGYSNSPDLAATGAGYAGGTCGALDSTFPCHDAFVARIGPDGATLDALSYLGGTGGDYAYGLAVDASGSVTVTGATTSHDFPVTWGAYQASGGGSNTDAFVARFDSSLASLNYSTYIGGAGADSAASVAVDAEGRAFIAGTTYGAGFPITANFQATPGNFYDAFLAVVNPAGTGLEFSTRLGGTGHDKAQGVAIDRFGNAMVAGETFSTDFPTAHAAQPSYGGGAFDGFAARIALGALPVLYTTASRLDFGEQRVSTTSERRDLILANIGGGELQFASITAEGEFSILGDCPALKPGESFSLAVSFSPRAPGERAGTLAVHHSGEGGTTQWALVGTGVAPEIRLSVAEIKFDPQLIGTESEPREITLTNSGTASLDLSGIHASGDFTQANDCPVTIPVSGMCTIRVSFTPKVVGAQDGTLAVTNALPEETRRALLSGSGSDFRIEADPNEKTITAGESGTFTITAVPLGGFGEELSLTCAGGPKAASCSIERQRITLDGANPIEVRVIVSTTARATVTPRLHERPQPISPWLIAFLALVAAIHFAARHTCRPRPARVVACALAAMFALAACGGGVAPAPPAPSRGTPAGTYTLTVTASLGNISKAAPLVLIVR